VTLWVLCDRLRCPRHVRFYVESDRDLLRVSERTTALAGLGPGDVKLAAVAGAWLDWFTIVAVVEVAALAALATYFVWRYALRRPIAATTPLPFGLFLAPAIWAGWLAQTTLGR
jgi:leader peptidase (prepilin peptidase)/N-methyltransferase